MLYSGTIPDSYGNWSFMTELNFESNRLTGICYMLYDMMMHGGWS